MTDDGKKRALDIINDITSSGCTALWDGLHMGMKAAEDCSIDATVILITDGQPSSSPAMGEVDALKAYRTKSNNNARLHTIGIGYDINSILLADLAAQGNTGGIFHFVPDGTMTITTFVNLIANERCVIGKELTIDIRGVSSMSTAVQPSAVQLDSSGACISLGMLRYGQSRDIVVKTDTQHKGMWIASYIDTQTNEKITLPAEFEKLVDDSYLKQTEAIHVVDKASAHARVDVVSAAKTLTCLMDYDESCIPMIKDVFAEVVIAFAPDKWTRWGQHYIRALCAAHINQVCTNFKDKGLQDYGGGFFRDIKANLNAICNAMPPPVPSLYSTISHNFTYSAPTTTAAFNDRFNNASGGCFGGDGDVLMHDGTTKKIIEIQKGDILHGGATVVCVICFSKKHTITYCGISITPWHPVLRDDEWVFPGDWEYGSQYDYAVRIEDVFNFVLDKKHIVHINDVRACTLGHNFTGNHCIEHSFFGTEAVIQDLMQFPGWHDGFITISPDAAIKSPSTGRTLGYVKRSPYPNRFT